MIRNLRLFCQRVLPIVYDDSLSFQELLYKVVAKLNEVINVTNDVEGQIEAEVRQILNEWEADGTLEKIINTEIFEDLKIFYVPEDYQAVGDGETDCTQNFAACMAAMDAGPIKMLFIPPGKTYKLSETIAIPEGCTVFGAGADSVVYLDDSSTYFGVAFTNGGSNVTIENLNIQHKSTSEITAWSAMPGAVGIGTVKIKDRKYILSGSSEYDHQDNHNITVRNLICTHGKYAFQVEPDSSHTISDVWIDGIYAPDSLVSVSAKDYPGSVRNVHYNNITCDSIRYGNGAGVNENVTFNNFYCRFLRAADKFGTFTNGIVDASQQCNISSSIHTDHAAIYKASNVFTRVNFIGGNRHKCFHAYTQQSSPLIPGEYVLNECTFTDFANYQPNSAGAGQGFTYLNNCVFNNVELAEPIKLVVKGGTVPVRAGTNTYPTIYDNLLDPDSVTDGYIESDYTIVWRSCRIVGDMYFINLLIELSNSYVAGGELFRFTKMIPDFNSALCIGFNTADYTSRPLRCSRTGTSVNLNDNYGYTRVLVNWSFPISKRTV